MAKQKMVQRKIPLDGYIAPKPQNSADAFGNFSPQPPAFSDPQVVPAPSAAVRPVVDPPAPASPVPPLVP